MSHYTLRPRLRMPAETMRESPRWKQVVRQDGPVFHQDVALGNMTQWRILLCFDQSGALCVGIQGKGFYSFTGFAHWSYVQEKFDHMLEADARNVADLINAQFGYQDQKEFGRYEDELCRA